MNYQGLYSTLHPTCFPGSKNTVGHFSLKAFDKTLLPHLAHSFVSTSNIIEKISFIVRDVSGKRHNLLHKVI